MATRRGRPSPLTSVRRARTVTKVMFAEPTLLSSGLAGRPSGAEVAGRAHVLYTFPQEYWYRIRSSSDASSRRYSHPGTQEST